MDKQFEFIDTAQQLDISLLKKWDGHHLRDNFNY